MTHARAIAEATMRGLIDNPPGMHEWDAETKARTLAKLYRQLETGSPAMRAIAERHKPLPPGRTWERKRPDVPAVGFASLEVAVVGGVETWHRTLLPRLQAVEVVGYCSWITSRGDASRFGVPTGCGENDLLTLAETVDVLVESGLPDPSPLYEHCRVISVHHGELKCEWSKPLIKLRRGRTDLWACVNQEVAEHLQQKGEPAVYLPNAVYDGQLDPVPRGERPVVVWLGRFSGEKRALLALEIAKAMPGLDFRIIGGGRQKAALDVVAGELPNAEIVPPVLEPWEELSRAACFLSTSRLEGFGLSMAEAMLANVPVVAAPVGIARRTDLVEAVPVNAPVADWVAAVARAVHSPDLDTVYRARMHVEKRHRPEIIAAKWEQVIEGLSKHS